MPTPAPLWSAHALRAAPDVLKEIHAAYALAGATVHTAATFRTQRRAAGEAWEQLARLAVSIAREAVPTTHRVAGSIAPLEDCYHPERSPSQPGPEHAELATVLVDAGCDLLLCETFAHVGEAVAATQASAGRGLPVWTALTAGYRADLLTPKQAAEGALRLVDAGADAVLINCPPAVETLCYVDALVGAVGQQVTVGAYANAGDAGDGMGWTDDPTRQTEGAERYAALARRWHDAGAHIIGSCCGTGPATIAALRGDPALSRNTSTHSRKSVEK